MTKDEAVEALFEGKAVTHKSFMAHEFIRMDTNNYKYIDEEGIVLDIQMFWNYRTAEGFNDGWSILN